MSAKNSDQDSPTSKDNHQAPMIEGNKVESVCQFCRALAQRDAYFVNKTLYPFIKNSMLTLIKTEPGYELCQILIKSLDDSNFLDFISFINANFLEISFSEYGTKVIQRLVKNKFDEERKKEVFWVFSKIIRENFVKISTNECATYIIQKMISSENTLYNGYIYEEIKKNFLPIAKSKLGCYIIQKILYYGPPEQRESFIKIVLKNTFMLICDHYGNYVIQSVILFNDEKINNDVYKVISRHIIYLCKNQFSSIVIEKLLELKPKKIWKKLVNKILQKDKDIFELICNKYGNFIIQKILTSFNNSRLLKRVLSVIEKNMEKLEKSSFGKKVIANLRNNYPLLDNLVPCF